MARLAYPSTDPSMLEVLGQCIDALPQEDTCLRICQMRPSSLRGALEHALELESYQLASQKSGRPVREARLGMNKLQVTSAEQRNQPIVRNCDKVCKSA